MASIASVYVDILPSTAKIADGIKKALLEVDDDVRAAVKRWRRDIDRELGQAGGRSHRRHPPWSVPRHRRAVPK